MNRKKKPQHTNKGKIYKGPFQKNPNEMIQTVRKTMRPESEGPTIDTFSSIDSTTNITANDALSENKLSTTKKRRPTKEKRSKKVSLPQWVLWLLGIIGTAFVGGVGTIVYTHSNKFVAVEKDVDYIQKEIKEYQATIKEIDNKVINIDKNLELLDQKVDYQKGN